MRKMRRRIVAGVLALTLATGCAEGTKYDFNPEAVLNWYMTNGYSKGTPESYEELIEYARKLCHGSDKDLDQYFWANIVIDDMIGVRHDLGDVIGPLMAGCPERMNAYLYG